MNIKLIVFDVDGVLTDGKLYIGSDREEYKAFHTQDGMGISLAHYAGIKTAIITGRTSESVLKRAEELKIDYVHQGIHEKLEVMEQIMNDLNITLEEVCYVGDDINDLPILQVVGFSAAPLDAVPIVKQHVQYISTETGGNGAVREIIDHILNQTVDYNALLQDYLKGKFKITQ
ncbi:MULTISPECIES: KdsC family phosphatase [Metabacillus]|uniref:3-deoxy-D-manno-octulosonate 8-phosphate phosphatase n=2 Tax=Metabacillus TaxID=2675233 RepID=A0A179T5K8_9BACI|nr:MULTISPECIES: HAD-IIIA family hydrolase [Metabacillus]OAS87732.1 3-deoxy-D-manno-octulosonate 8-phosphate phosphatase [Metabacillus litoralis]QNF27231.1 HAD-IIIA family hydrolase [Metabacillus sp. KUDC1714]